MHPIDMLKHSTIKIVTENAAGEGSGTGFIVGMCATPNANGEINVPVLVTNKHVIEGAERGVLYMTGLLGEHVGPNIGDIIPMFIERFEERWIKHPDPEIDLAVLPLGPFLHEAKFRNTPVYFESFPMAMIADDAALQDLLAIEDVIMIGYPTGLWDETNNIPIVRRGITATPPGIRFNGRPEFVIDMACFPGSSGSPVLLFNPSIYVDKFGNTHGGATRLVLLGVLWGGPQYEATGDLIVVPVPTSKDDTLAAISSIPMNLGYCVRAEELRWFEQHIASEYAYSIGKLP